MSDSKEIVDEMRGIVAEMRAIKARFLECERDMDRLLGMARNGLARTICDVPDGHAAVLRYIVAHEEHFSAALLSMTDLEEALGRTRKSVRCSVDWLRGKGLIDREGRRMWPTDNGKTVCRLVF